MIGKVDERDLALGRVYARSLLGLAEERGETDRINEELQSLIEVADRVPELGAFLLDPLVDEEVRRRGLEGMLRGRVSDLLVDALQVMSRNGRLAIARAMAEAYRLEVEELRGEVDVYVTTAVPLDDGQRRQVGEAAARVSGRTPRLAEKVDESLLGGMIMRIGDRKFDTSLAKELRALGRRLVERGSTEIHGGRRYYAEAEGELGV